MEETRKCIEVYITKREGDTEETLEFRNMIENTPENKEWFRSASDVMKQLAYILCEIHKDDITEVEEVNADDREGTTSK